VQAICKALAPSLARKRIGAHCGGLRSARASTGGSKDWFPWRGAHAIVWHVDPPAHFCIRQPDRALHYWGHGGDPLCRGPAAHLEGGVRERLLVGASGGAWGVAALSRHLCYQPYFARHAVLFFSLARLPRPLVGLGAAGDRGFAGVGLGAVR